MAETPKQDFHGSCHCGHITYDVSVALPDPKIAGRCNCTICLKTAFTPLKLASAADFTLKTPASLSEVPDYQYGRSPDIHRYFCAKCGVNVFISGWYEYEGQKFEIQNVNLMTLDQPQEGLELSEWKVEYVDGRNDNWFAGQKEKPWPGGLV